MEVVVKAAEVAVTKGAIAKRATVQELSKDVPEEVSDTSQVAE
jgi:hypothetical protein